MGDLITGHYIASIPLDPLNDSGHKYRYTATVGRFKINAHFSETITDSDTVDEAKQKAGEYFDPSSGGTKNFTVASDDYALINW